MSSSLMAANCCRIAAIGIAVFAVGSCGGNRTLDVDDYDRSCTTADQCVNVTTGDMCGDAGACLCGGSAINAAAEAEWRADLEAIDCGLFKSDVVCGCAAPLLECIDRQCVASFPELE